MKELILNIWDAPAEQVLMELGSAISLFFIILAAVCICSWIKGRYFS